MAITIQDIMQLLALALMLFIGVLVLWSHFEQIYLWVFHESKTEGCNLGRTKEEDEQRKD